MKNILIVITLLFSSTALAITSSERDDLCASLAVRYTIFSTFATKIKTKEEYESFLYKLVIESDADKSTQTILISLIDSAWKFRNEPIVDTATKF